MTHLSPEELVDLAEGGTAAVQAAHAVACEACRARVESLRDALRLAESDRTPEPSPLLWPQLAARIGEAVRLEQTRESFWRSWWWRLAPAGAVAVLVMAVGIGARIWPGTAGERPAATEDAAPVQHAAEPAADAASADDPSWLLVSDLSAEVTMDDAEAAGALTLPGGMDRALLQLNEDERSELARILRDELTNRRPAESKGPGA